VLDKKICTKSLVERPILQHVVGGGQQRGCHCDGSFFGSASSFDAEELCLIVGSGLTAAVYSLGRLFCLSVTLAGSRRERAGFAAGVPTPSDRLARVVRAASPSKNQARLARHRNEASVGRAILKSSARHHIDESLLKETNLHERDNRLL
jgi:hypothetical protein